MYYNATAEGRGTCFRFDFCTRSSDIMSFRMETFILENTTQVQGYLARFNILRAALDDRLFTKASPAILRSNKRIAKKGAEEEEADSK